MDCATSRERCADSTGDAHCMPWCEDECEEEGEEWCVGDHVMMCLRRDVPDGFYNCLYVRHLYCERLMGVGGTCHETGDSAYCVESCGSECDEGDTMCEENRVMVCRHDDDDLYGCFEWYRDIDCEAEGLSCVEEGGEARCVCDDVCTPGETRCRGTAIEQCEESTDGCLVWAEAEDCGAGRRCDSSGATPECVCDPSCARPGETRCRGTAIERCEESAGGCLGWVAVEDCATGGERCDDSGDEALCRCEDECDAEGDTWCDTHDAHIQWQCLRDHSDGCLYALDMHCGLLYGRWGYCRETGGTANCTDGCSDWCYVFADPVCSGNQVLSCVSDEDPPFCTYWEAMIDCEAEGLSCVEDDDGARCG